MIKTTVNVSKVATVPVIKNLISSIEKTGKKLKILHLEDVSSDAVLVNNQLKKSKLDYEILVVDTKDKFIKELKDFTPDIILCDHTLPSFNSHEALLILNKTGFKIPFIIVTATMSDEFAADMIIRGADDYIIKDRLHRLPIAIHNALEKFRLKQEQQFFINENIKKEKQYHALIENSNDAIIIFNLEGKPTYVSRSIKRVLGYTEEEAIQLGIYKIVHPDEREALSNKMIQCLEERGGCIEGHVCRVKHKDGRWRWMEATMTNMLHDPAVNGIVNNFRDITERKLTEIDLLESREEMKTVFDASLDAIIIIDEEGKITKWDSKAELLFGWKDEEVIGTLLSDSIIPPGLREAHHVGMKHFLKTGEGPILNKTIEVKALKKDKTEINISLSISPTRSKNKYQFIGFIRDISERKVVEEALQNSESNMQAIFENTSDGFILTDINGIIKSFNSKARDRTRLNMDLEITVGKSIFDFLPDSRKKMYKDNISKILSGKTLQYDYPFTRKSGNTKWFSFTINPVYNAEKIEGISITATDITERKIAEQQLQKSESRLKEAQAVANIGSWETNLQTFNVIWSEETHHIFETDPNKFNPTRAAFIDFIHHDDRNKVNTAFENSFNSQTINSIEYRIISTNGGLKYICESWKILRDGQGNPVRAVGTCQDITDRKIAENKLNATSQQLETVVADLNKILDYSLDVICTINGNGEFVTVSVASQQVWGYTPEELIGTRFMNLVYHEDVERTSKAAEKLANSIKVPIFENRYVHKSGRIVHILWSVNWDEKLKLMFCIAKDVTEKKNLEDLLDKSNRLARIGSWEYNIITHTHFWSQNTREIYELEDDLTPDLQTGIRYYKSGVSRSSISNAVDKALKDGTPWDLELQIVTAKGNELWVHDIGEAEFINGKCIRLYGSFQDIDARKKAEIETLKAYEEKNIILESIGDGFFAIDKEWKVTYWNKEAEKMLLASKNKIIGNNLWEIFSDSIDSESYKKYHEAIEENVIIRFEDYYAALDKWFAISAYPSVTGLSVFFKDITDRKLSEIELSALNLKLTKHADELATSNRELEDFAYVASHDLQEPLRMVTGFLGQIEKKYTDIIDDKGKQYIHFATDGAKRMRQIILDLLEFSRVGKVEEKEENIDLYTVVREVILLCNKKIKETNAIINIENLPSLLICKTPLRQVFQNLVSNALKYHKKNQPPVISISAEEASTYWQFAIKDNGIGIEEEYFNKIFIIFQRLHNKDEYTGTGIGLAVCKKIIENFGGKIWLASEENKGSTFYFTIPKK